MPYRLVLAAALVCASASLGGAAEGGRYLPDIVAAGPQAGAIKAMMTGSPKSLAWVEKLEGPSGPSRIVEVAGERREIGYVCKLNSCVNNQFRVLFSADGARAVGLLIGRDGAQFFGAPTSAERQALIATDQP